MPSKKVKKALDKPPIVWYIVYMKFEDLKFEKRFEDGVQALAELPNGYEVSIIKNSLSYGGDKGLYEIGVYGPHGGMCDPLGWGDDVKGWLTPEDVEHYIQRIERV